MAISAATVVKTLLIFAGTVYILMAMRSFLPLLFDLPTILAWLKPPYIYFIINGIILSLVFSSRFQHDRHEKQLSGGLPKLFTATTPPPADLASFAHPEVKSVVDESFLAAFGGQLEVPELKPAAVVDGAMVCLNDEKLADDGAIIENDEAVEDEEATFTNSAMDPPTESGTEMFLSAAAEKPLVSSRFAHRGKQSVRSTPEGGRGLRVARQKKQLETLESTWKTITEGRHAPLTRRLKKSDPLENHQNLSRGDAAIAADGDASGKRPVSRNPGMMILRKEPSLSQDELNRRVEAFIKKFNEEMRIQRQESLQQYKEMINRGAN